MLVSDTVLVAGITAAAGLGSALIGARTANRRAAETFAHERSLRDEDRVRASIDNVLEAAEADLALLLEIHAHLAHGAGDQIVDAWGKAVTAEGDVGRRLRQLMLRLHRHDEIVTTIDAYRKKLFETRVWLSDLSEEDQTPSEDHWKTFLSELADIHARVLDLTSTRFGSTVADAMTDR